MGSNWTIDDSGMCSICGHFAEDKDLHIFKLHNERHAMIEEYRSLAARARDVEGMAKVLWDGTGSLRHWEDISELAKELCRLQAAAVSKWIRGE